MSLLIKIIGVCTIGFTLSFFDVYIIGIPPVSPTMAVILQMNTFNGINVYFLLMLVSFFVGLGATCSLFVLRKFGSKVLKIERFYPIQNITNVIDIIVNEIGYIIIIPLVSTSLSMAVGVAFLFTKKVNYMKYFIGIYFGRLLILALFVIGTDNVISFLKEPISWEFNNILLIPLIGYVLTFGIVIFLMVTKKGLFKRIKNKYIVSTVKLLKDQIEDMINKGKSKKKIRKAEKRLIKYEKYVVKINKEK